MRYMLLIYGAEKDWAGMSDDQRGRIMQDYMSFTDGIRKSGHYVAGDALQDTTTATTVRAHNGKPASTDGPFAETREQLGGFYIIKAANLDEATEIAARVPSAKWGSIEVRPVLEMA